MCNLQGLSKQHSSCHAAVAGLVVKMLKFFTSLVSQEDTYMMPDQYCKVNVTTAVRKVLCWSLPFSSSELITALCNAAVGAPRTCQDVPDVGGLRPRS